MRPSIQTQSNATIDAGHPANVHPTNKRIVGERLAALAAHGDAARAPVPRLFSSPSANITIGFDKPLTTNDGGETVRGFTAAFEPAGAFTGVDATLKGSAVTLKAARRILEYRYAWADDPRDANLVGLNGHPVAPFRTDRRKIASAKPGETWKIGTGVEADTNEAQLVQLGDGSIMINCRDLRGGSRRVAITRDLGQTWTEHPTSRKALPEPVCQASILRIEHQKHGPLLFFANPPQAQGRTHMTIKVSADEGMTWPEKWHTLVDERSTAYSCLTRVDEDHIGPIYEGVRELYFVRYSIEELMRN